MERLILLTGFAPFGGERGNPSWDVAAHFDKMQIGGATVKALRLPVNCARAARMTSEAIERLQPVIVIGLGQAGGRPALSLEKIAINLANERAAHEIDGAANAKPVVPNGPAAYFSRLPMARILRALKRHGLPATLSLTAGAYVCNSVMYATLHTLRRRRNVAAGFIHLPYTAAQASRHRAVASMSLELMTAGVAIALETTSRRS